MKMDLIVLENNGVYTVDSREVARMVEKNHKDLLRDIRKYCEILIERNFTLNEYFIESTYEDTIGRELPCYLCTKKRV